MLRYLACSLIAFAGLNSRPLYSNFPRNVELWAGPLLLIFLQRSRKEMKIMSFPNDNERKFDLNFHVLKSKYSRVRKGIMLIDF